MTRQKLHRHRRRDVPSDTADPTNSQGAAPSDDSPHDQIDRLAELIADGQANFSDIVDSDRTGELIAKVAQRRRTQLVNYIARAIALDIQQSREPSSKD